MKRWIVIVSGVALLLGLCGVLGVYEVGRMRARQKELEQRALVAENIRGIMQSMELYSASFGEYPVVTTLPAEPLLSGVRKFGAAPGSAPAEGGGTMPVEK